MRWIAVCVFTLALSMAVYAAGVLPYRASLLTLGVNYSAKLACSCYFVTHQSESFCQNYIRVSPNIFTADIDPQAKEVRASTLFFWRARAVFRNERLGCRLEAH